MLFAFILAACCVLCLLYVIPVVFHYERIDRNGTSEIFQVSIFIDNYSKLRLYNISLLIPIKSQLKTGGN